MWVGWFSLILVGMTGLVFHFRKVGRGIINEDGIGNVYLRWLLLMTFLPGLAIASATMFLFLFEDVLTISLVGVGLSMVYTYAGISLFRVRQFRKRNINLSDARRVASESQMYKHIFILLGALFVVLLFMFFIFTLYWFFP